MSGKWQELLPALDHDLEFLDKGIDFFKIFATPFFRLQIEGAAESDHIAQITNLSRGGLFFGLLEYGIPDLGKLGFDPCGVDLDGFAKGFANERELFREGLHR